MKMQKLIIGIVIAVIAGLVPMGIARADGFIFPEPPICPPVICIDPPCPPSPCPPRPLQSLAVRYHHVNVKIENQIAVTRIDQVFYNPNDVAIEGTYIFPLPLEATVTSFKLWVDGEAVEGQVLEATEARKKYEEIVSSLRDPALLEYADRGAVQAKIFPIPAGGERRVALEYIEVLKEDGGLVRYQYPLNTEKFSAFPLDSVVINVELGAERPIRAVYSPSHDISVRQDDLYHALVGYEAEHVLPDQDFTLFYSLGESEAFHLISLHDPGDSSEEDGYFLLILAPKPFTHGQTVAKDVLLVLDRSGSMEGEKFQQGLTALEAILDHLNEGDRFNVLAFSTDIQSYAEGLRPAKEADQAKTWLRRLSAEGSTDIHQALLRSAELVDESRPTYLIFITDGLPTVGVVDSGQILADFQRSAPKNLRVFAFGVGYDVDTFLLDSLTQAHHGLSQYVKPEEDLNRAVSSFYEKIRTPVMTDLALDFGSLSVYDVYPQPLPDLFSGSQIILTGRYRGGGKADLTLRGKVNEQEQIFRYRDQTFGEADEGGSLTTAQQAIPRLWATRKIGYLLNQVRLNGPSEETIEQIVRLSIRYGIVTPYTSYLVTEPTPLGEAEQSRIIGEQLQQLYSAPAMDTSGMGAVQKAAEQGAMAGAEAPVMLDQEITQRVKVVGTRTFILNNGVWTDTAYDEKTMSTVKVAFLSADYFAIIKDNPELRAAFALGERVIALSRGKAYEVVPGGESQAEVDLSTPVATETVVPYPPAGRGADDNAVSLYPCISAGIVVLMSLILRRIY